MCRLAYFPPGSEPLSKHGIRLLEALCAAQGRDGMGVGALQEKGFAVVKGINAKPEASIKGLKGHERGLIFHARLASSGGQKEELCQPFVFGETMTVHNGHWTDWKQAIWGLIANGGIKPGDGLINDSACAAALVGRVGRFALNFIETGVFITWKKGERWPVATVRAGDFAYSSLPEGGIIYASSFPSWWPVEAFEFPNDSLAVLTPAGPHMLYGTEPYRKGNGSGSRGVWNGKEYTYSHGYGA